MHSFYLNAIKSFEGYTPAASWDYAQLSSGYGTKAQYAGEVIDKAEADRRFQSEIKSARAIVDKVAPQADEGTKAALTSLTYNAGDAWVKSGLGDAVRRGDLDQTRAIFQQYNKAGGEVLPGLVSRRAAEALWIGNPSSVAGASVADAGAAPTVQAAAGPVRSTPEGLSFLQSRPVMASASPSSQAIPAASMVSEHSGSSASAEAALLTLKRLSGDGLAALSAMQAGSTSDAPLTSSRLSEMARLVRLDNGHALLRAGEHSQDSERTRA